MDSKQPDTPIGELDVPLLGEQPCSFCAADCPSHHDPEKVLVMVQDSKQRRQNLFCLIYLNILLLLVSVILLIKSGLGASCTCEFTPPSPREALRYTSSWSPVFDQVDLAPQLTTVDGSLYSQKNLSIYRGEPSDETDTAWDDLAAEAYEVILVDSDTMKRAGFNPDHYFKAPKSWQSSKNAALDTEVEDQDLFPVQIDIFHQIHCLNAVRKQMHYQYYFAAKFSKGHPDEMHWMHLRHCLHMVLQSLTCSADVDIVPHRWVEKSEVPFAQFGITKKCRNFDNLRQWNRENAVQDIRAVWPRNKKSMPKDAFVWPGHGEEGE